MRLVDLSPPMAPTAEQQTDALRKGLGRAVQFAKSGRLDRQCLLLACLTDYRFDQQLEETRTTWLWGLILANDCVGEFRNAILASLQDQPPEDSAQQRVELGFRYAATGDLAFREPLYAIVRQRLFPERPWIAENELIALDGVEGFLAVARIRGSELADRDWEWDDRSFAEEAAERLGIDQVWVLLTETADPDLARFRDHWAPDQSTPKGDQRSAYMGRLQALTVAEIVKSAESPGGNAGNFRGWGRIAAGDDLALIFDRLISAEDPNVASNYLRVFSDRPMPRFDPRLLHWCLDTDHEVRRRALLAVSHVAHPAVRDFALSQAANGIRSGDVVSLFNENYMQGDEHLILEAIELPDDINELHWLLQDVIELAKLNPAADRSKLVLMAYALTPCALCRASAVDLLVNQNCAPQWLIDECRFDCDEEVMKLVQTRGTATTLES